MATLFTKIVQGEIACHKIAENEKFLAFLDVNPLADGHTLVIPKREVDYIFELGDSELSELMVFAKKVSQAVKKAISCKKVGAAVIGLEVPHAHVHLVPLNSVNDISFSHPKMRPTAESLAATAARIRSYCDA